MEIEHTTKKNESNNRLTCPDHLCVMANNVEIVSMRCVCEVVALQEPGPQCEEPERAEKSNIIQDHASMLTRPINFPLTSIRSSAI
jgi:hypothetical protein